MDFTFFRIDNNARDRATGEPVWVTEKADGITQRNIHVRCLVLLGKERFEDVKAIQDEFILE